MGGLFLRIIKLWMNSMNTRLATIAITALLLLVQTASAQITVPQRFVQIRSIDLTTSVLELFNSGTTSQPLAGWRFCTHDEDSIRRYSPTTGLNSFTLESGESLFVHFNNDADPNDPLAVNVSTIGGAFAQPLDAEGAYGAQIYFQNGFGNGANIADHVQFSVDGLDNTTADDRSDEAEGEVWDDQNEWVAISLDTEMIVLDEASIGNELHSPADYMVVDSVSVVLGDLNGDSLVSFADIPPFIDALTRMGHLISVTFLRLSLCCKCKFAKQTQQQSIAAFSERGFFVTWARLYASAHRIGFHQGKAYCLSWGSAG